MRRLPLVIVAMLVTSFATQAFADGFIIVPRHPPSRPEVRTIPLAVKYHRVKVTIRDQVATTEIDQVFINPNPYQLEGTYIFPLPDGASISAFSMFIDGKEIAGEILEKAKARKIYEDIVRSMQDPALLEYVGREMFKASIFPIPALGEKRVKLSYQEICPADGGLVKYRYPLNTEKFSSRPLEDVSVVIDISGKLPIKNITCPTHPVEVVRKGETTARVAYEAKNVTPDTDLLLYYSLSADEFAMNFLTHRGKTDEKGYFMLLLSPSGEQGKVLPKDVCFVLDTSGSMQGGKIEQARNALKFCVQSLNEGDRFNIVTFATEARPFRQELQAASPENIAKAVEHVAGLRALGGTAIDEALGLALGMSPDSDRPYMVVFLTDGLPTIGETKAPVILANVARMNRGNVRLFAFGLGNDVNTHLLDNLAAQNRGTRDYVAETEDLEIKISSFYSKVANPVLSDLELTFPDLEVMDIYPRRMPDLFKGSQLVVVGRFGGAGSRAVKLTGKVAGESRTLAHDVTFPESEAENAFLPRLWAIRKIGFLLDEIRLHGEKGELKNEVVRLAKLHGVVTPYTSFLVLEDQAQRRQTARRDPGFGGRDWDGRRGSGPGFSSVGRGGGGSGAGESGVGGGPAPTAGTPPSADAPDAFGRDRADEEEKAREGLRRATGKASIDASKGAAKLKGELAEADDFGYVDAGRLRSKQLMQLVEGIAFYRRGAIWRQADLPEKAERRALTLFSTEYFELLKKDPRIGKLLALGQVDFLFEGIVYQVRQAQPR